MTIVSPMGQLRPVFADKNGKRLSGGKVFTYEPGTLTPKATYTDALNLIPNTNPIDLNKYGEADIFLNGDYRIRVVDRHGVLIDDYDNLMAWATKRYLDLALSGFASGASKFYPTLAAANADIANIAVSQIVNIGELENGGLWFKESAESTTLTKAPYDTLELAKQYSNQKQVVQEQYINDLFAAQTQNVENLINQQGVSLQQLDEYYNYLMERLAQIAVDKGWDASLVVDASGKSQQEVNDLLSYATYKTPRQFGGKPNDPAFDNKFALQAAMDSDEPIFLDGLYYTTQAPVITKLKTIAGVNQETTGIVKVGNALSGLSSVAIDADPSHNDIYDVDAILIVRGGAYNSGLSNLYVQGLDFKNFRLDRHNYTTPATNENAFGFYAPRLARSSFESFYVNNKDFGTGVRSFNIWLCKWSRCESRAYDTWHFGASRDQAYPYNGAGTSNMMLDCWSREPKNFAYQFIGLQYSSAMNLACDYGGTEANPMQYVYYVSGTTNMTFINCAAEHIHGRLIWVSPYSRAVFIDPDFYTGIYGRKGNGGALIRVNNSRFKMINGRISLDLDSDSAYLQVSGASKVSIENLETNIDVVGIERGDSNAITTADKSKIYINGGYVEFTDGANTIEHGYEANKTKLETPMLTTQNKTNQVTGQGNTFLTAGSWNTSKFGFGDGRLWRSYHKLYYKRDAEPTFENDGYLVNVHLGSGLFANAPVNNVGTLPLDAGQFYYCTQTNQPMFWSGTKYVNATGGNASATKPSITGKTTPTTIAEQNAVINSLISSLVALGLITDNRTT